MALLDLPRPEMIINAWAIQNSTANPKAIGAFTRTIRNLVATYNGAIEEVVYMGWKSVQRQMETPGFFDEPFYSYVADTYIADTYKPGTPKGAQEAAQKYLDTSQATMADEPVGRTRVFGVCPVGRYCLGYGALFHPLKPRLTDLLLTFIAARNPEKVVSEAIHAAQGTSWHPEEVTCDGIHDPQVRDRCRAIWKSVAIDRELQKPPSCTSDDYASILGSFLHWESGRMSPHPYLHCFEQAVLTRFSDAGLLRAALADFLFNYKMSQQYPHEFSAYDLSLSADALNVALAPIIDAFNRDIVAYQTFMRADVQHEVDRINDEYDQRCCVKRLFGLSKPWFFNDGLVTVRTISGLQSTVNTVSQNVLNVSSAPTLANLANAILNPTSASGNSPVSTLLGSPQASAALVAGVLNAYQTTYAQIGRSLTVTVTPRSLATASSAEMSVTLNADESAGIPYYSNGPTAGIPPNNSRVATHDTVTRIRVESVKLFEVSSFSAIVARSRSKFPLLPPFVEIPYIGTIAGIPLPGAKEYHGSFAIMSAIVVPTAADIGVGLKFLFDQVLDGDPANAALSRTRRARRSRTPAASAAR